MLDANPAGARVLRFATVCNANPRPERRALAAIAGPEPEDVALAVDGHADHGESLVQTSTLPKENYAYDGVGRLTETQETPAGKGCTSRLYGYDEEGDRTSETTRESATETCPSEGGTTQTHSYDGASLRPDTSGKQAAKAGRKPAGTSGVPHNEQRL
jgi:hypothetical protein